MPRQPVAHYRWRGALYFAVRFGRFDAIAIIEAPDGPTAAKFILNMMGTAKVRTETMTAFDDVQIAAIADGLFD